MKVARQARYPYLFFVHEDVKFHSQDWGTVVAEKLAEPSCGVIGFAGTKIMFDCYSDGCSIVVLLVLLIYKKKEM